MPTPLFTAMDLEDLRKIIENGTLPLDCSSNVIESGKLRDCNDILHSYTITNGWNIVFSNKCDREWQAYFLKLFEFIEKQNYAEEKLGEILSEIQTQDLHWDWFKKSVAYTTPEYEWFYLIADNKPQGACLIYHPKDSITDARKIFYIEYLAVAPWNRNNPMGARLFRGVGSILLKCALSYAVNTLGLEYGFSLHSLAQAKDYYKKIGMESYPARDKEHLFYFEMSRANSTAMLGGT
ncbi:GNAT family N-acetyltransferase [Thiovibrio frasassiensis]|uniref:GNAT family N-acetyltransferase n=1 Tax=Thiovibrio frasassiensis TaxID=2984131 RepID=A0A9X4MFG9_9BACT|nr:GNAT family N-acetyltransferase [Thiovibrio frasassiensis]MDG4475391.1 GNAT family N-acetyltransferase [Thiovibrio frasassiensis]